MLYWRFPSAPVAQLDRASASGAEGCRFEPYRAYQTVNNLAEPPLSACHLGQTGDKFSERRPFSTVVGCRDSLSSPSDGQARAGHPKSLEVNRRALEEQPPREQRQPGPVADFQLPTLIGLPGWELEPVRDEEASKPEVNVGRPAISLLADDDVASRPEASGRGGLVGAPTTRPSRSPGWRKPSGTKIRASRVPQRQARVDRSPWWRSRS